jgi:hypothetical protein
MSKVRVLVLCFSCFTDNSNVMLKIIASKYHTKLAALTLIILFSEMLKLSNFVFFFMKIIPLLRKVLNLQEYSVC